jgi:hypothetical protein
MPPVNFEIIAFFELFSPTTDRDNNLARYVIDLVESCQEMLKL